MAKRRNTGLAHVRTTQASRAWRGLAALCSLVVALLAALWSPLAAAQTTPAVDAGQLLEQQRRLDEQRTPPPTLRELLDAGAPTAPSAPPADDTRFAVSRFELSGHTLIDTALLQAELAPWLARPLTLTDLRQAAAAITRRYRDAGWLVQVAIPPQDVTEGLVRLAVTEARFGQLRIQAPDSGEDALPPGLRAHVERLLQARLVAGTPLNLDALEHVLQLADEVPGVRATGSLQAGAAAGSTDVLLVLGRTPVRQTLLSLDNSANRATGNERLTGQLSLASPLGHGEQFGLTASKTRSSSYLRAAASLPLGAQGLRLAAAASGLRYQVLNRLDTSAGLPPRGDSRTLGLDLQWPLLRSAAARLDLETGLERRAQDNQDDVQVPGRRDTTRSTRQRIVSFGFSGQRADRLGRGGQSQASLTLGLGRLGLAGSPSSLQQSDAATAATAGPYETLRLRLGRVQALTPTLSLQVDGQAQWASRNLDASEKFYLGGPSGIRAYPSGEAGGSSGQMLNLALLQQLGPRLQLSAFYDRGQVRQYERNRRADGNGELVAEHNRIALQGAGLGLAYTGGHGERLQATWARRIGSNPLATPGGQDSDGSLHRHRLWLSASLSF